MKCPIHPQASPHRQGDALCQQVQAHWARLQWKAVQEMRARSIFARIFS
jgi:hypothetical protein